jgi:hypothetical protein
MGWVVGVPAAVVIAGGVAFFVAREPVPAATPVQAAAQEADPQESTEDVGVRLQAECKKIYPEADDGTLDGLKVLVDCKIALLKRRIETYRAGAMDDAYKRVFKK